AALVLVMGSPEVWDSGDASWRALARYAGDPAYRQPYLDGHYGYGPEHTLAGYLRDHTAPGDSVYVWGFDPMVYILAGRPAASRFPLMSDWAPRRWQDDFVAELERSRPAYIVIQRGRAGNWIVGHNIDMADYGGFVPAFHDLLERDYSLET